MRKILFFAIAAALLVLASFLFKEEVTPAEAEPKQETREDETAIVSQEISVLKEEPVLILSSIEAEQSDTIVVKLRGVPAGVVPVGTFFLKAVSFFQTVESGSWTAILGIGAKREHETYSFKVEIGSADTLKGEIHVSQRNFPVTELVVTKELQEQGYSPATIAKNIATVENTALRVVLGEYTKPFLANKSFFYPLNVIQVVGAYGNVRKSKDVVLQHLGVDLAADTGTNVYAVNDAVVVLTRDFVNYGRTIVLDHGFGIYSLYLHLDEMIATKGEFVKRGEIIGYSGNTGYSIAPHLHFSFKVSGESVDPLRFIETVNNEF
ncbi:M23 family metallopeptidase [Patescibacteria group bacterium]|nr:M23 family metallopeptidase [Patescibacteria group bacterium]